jgi:malate permease and related proteins
VGRIIGGQNASQPHHGDLEREGQALNVLLSIFAADILPIFLIAGVGYLIARYLSANVKTLAHVVFYALVPCLVFNLLITSKMTGAQFGRMALLAILVLAAMGLIARLVAIPLRLNRSELSAFLLVLMFSNSGNYGLPVVLFAFGPEALTYATAFFVTGSLLTYTVGVFIAAAGRRSLRDALAGLVRIPAIYSVAAATIVLLAGVQLPLAVTRPVALLSDAALPMMILVLGMQLERATRPERPVLVVVAVVISLLVAPMVAIGLASFVGVSGTARQAAVLLSSMPVAVVTTILALEFDLPSAFVTSAVFASTLLSPLTLTPLIAYLRS